MGDRAKVSALLCGGPLRPRRESYLAGIAAERRMKERMLNAVRPVIYMASIFGMLGACLRIPSVELYSAAACIWQLTLHARRYIATISAIESSDA